MWDQPGFKPSTSLSLDWWDYQGKSVNIVGVLPARRAGGVLCDVFSFFLSAAAGRPRAPQCHLFPLLTCCPWPRHLTSIYALCQFFDQQLWLPSCRRESCLSLWFFLSSPIPAACPPDTFRSPEAFCRVPLSFFVVTIISYNKPPVQRLGLSSGDEL